MKLSSKKPTEKKMTFTVLTEKALHQVKGGTKNQVESKDDQNDID